MAHDLSGETDLRKKPSKLPNEIPQKSLLHVITCTFHQEEQFFNQSNIEPSGLLQSYNQCELCIVQTLLHSAFEPDPVLIQCFSVALIR